MKAKLKFDLTDYDDRIEHERCLKATDMAIVLWELTLNSRKKILNSVEEGTNFEDYEKGVMAVYKELHSLLEEHGVIPDKLIV